MFEKFFKKNVPANTPKYNPPKPDYVKKGSGHRERKGRKY